MPNTSKLRNLLSNFLYNANPAHKGNDEPCTVGELRQLMQQIEILVDGIIKELDDIK